MYDVKVNPLREDLVKRIHDTDWDNFPPMLVGWDIYVDVDGNVGFYEGNSIPFALGDYRWMFGTDLNEAIIRELRKHLNDTGVVGINVDPSIDTSGKVHTALIAKDFCESVGIPVVMSNELTTKWDEVSNKLYFDDKHYGSRKNFDILFNRCPGAQRNLREQVPRDNWISAPIMSPVAHTLMLANKERTKKAFRTIGLDMPVAYIAKNDGERREAMQKVMAHIREEHPNYVPPFILIKPVAGTGARRVRIFEDDKSTPSFPVKYPCLVGERITAAGLEEHDGTHMIDTRMFYCGGYASHGIGRVAPLPIEKGSYQDGKGFKTESYVTNLCRGGHTSRLSERVEKVFQQYALAGALAIDEGSKKYIAGELE